MQPYFTAHPVGFSYLALILIWYGAEFVQLLRQQQWRAGATKAGPRVFWSAVVACGAATYTMFVLAPRLLPGADISHPLIAFAVGMLILATGVSLRLWSFQALGHYFTFTVKVSPDQPVVADGPYRLLRHPGYAGGLLAMIGISVLYGNWASLATTILFWLALLVWRIRVEERALLATLDGRYAAYAAQHKRLIPLVW